MGNRSRQTMLAKIEATYGVDPVPVPGTDSVRVQNLAFAWSDVRKTQPASTKPSFGSEASIFGGALGTVTFDAFIKGSGVGAGDVPPEIGPVLRGASMLQTINLAVSVVYTPITTGQESLALYFYDDGKRYIMLGARANASFAFPAGAPGMVSLSYTGHTALATDQALVSPVFNTIQPHPFLGASFLADGFAAKIANLSLDMANEIAKSVDVSAADGYGEMKITGRAMTGSFDPEETLVAAYDWESKWQTDAQVAINSGLVGATAGNRWQLAVAAAQYAEPTKGEREKVAIFEVPFAANEISGDDEFSLTFT